MKHIVTQSGGKDSETLAIWAEENLGEPGVDWIPAFWDTKWENALTYAHLAYLNKAIYKGQLIIRSSKNYPGGFTQLCIDRKGFPSVKRRFCTQELKVMVQHEYIQELDDEVTIYQGIRADESHNRAHMPMRQWTDEAGGYWIERPLLKWTADQVFAKMAERGVLPNPLYLRGHTRVGCKICIMTGLRELKQLLLVEPEIREWLPQLETDVNAGVSNRDTRKWLATFFASGTIPDRFCSLRGIVQCRRCDGVGKVEKLVEAPLLVMIAEPSIITCTHCGGAGEYEAFVPTAKDVISYIDSVDEDQLPMLETPRCMSAYNLCE